MENPEEHEGLTWLHCSPESNPVPLQRASAEVQLPLIERRVVLEMLEAVFWGRKTKKLAGGRVISVCICQQI